MQRQCILENAAKKSRERKREANFSLSLSPKTMTKKTPAEKRVALDREAGKHLMVFVAGVL